MKEKILKASSQVKGSIKLPGSKSITNRVLLMAALASGTTKIVDPYLLSGEDQLS